MSRAYLQGRAATRSDYFGKPGKKQKALVRAGEQMPLYRVLTLYQFVATFILPASHTV
jgi:hypothetical protein